MDARTRSLLEAPIGRTLMRLAIPNMLVMVAQASVGLIEMYFVAKLGIDALAGLAFVFPVLMLVQMVSAGAMGGGILSAVSRALGANRREEANALVWHAAAIALGLGLATTLAAFTLAPGLYVLLGARGAALDAAVIYSNLVFAGAVAIWLFNSLAAVIRGTGNMMIPASVTSLGALLLIPASPVLIFGLGPVPALGIAGGALALIIYYSLGSLVFVFYLWSGRGVLHPAARPPRLRWAPTREILRVGALSSLVSVTTNVTIATATGLVGQFGPAAAAGYGTGSRLEYLLVPLVFGLGAPIAAMVGTSMGAGRRDRALRVAWIGAAVAGVMTGSIGLAAAIYPEAWLSLFGSDPAMIEAGSRYLQIVGPFYGFFGVALALYFASQGAGRLGWPLTAAILRMVIGTLGGAAAIALWGSPTGVYAMLALALAVFGIVNVAALAWGRWRPLPAPIESPLR